MPRRGDELPCWRALPMLSLRGKERGASISPTGPVKRMRSDLRSGGLIGLWEDGPMRDANLRTLALLACFITMGSALSWAKDPPRVLFISKSSGFEHPAIA